MINLLSADFMRAWKSKAIRIVTLIFTVLLLFNSVIFFAFESLIDELPPGLLPQMSISTSLVNLTDTFTFGILLAIIVNVFVTKDYSQGTIRNFMVSGESRSTIFISKSIVSIITTMVILSLGFLVLTIFVGLVGGWGDVFSLIKLLEFIGRFLLILLIYGAFTSIIIFLAHSVKSTGGVIGLTIAIVFVFQIFQSITMYGDFMFSVNGEDILANQDSGLFIKIVDVISKIFVGNHIQGIAALGGDILDVAIAAAVSVATILVFTILGIIKFKKSDLK